jgi:hypothetical protein
VARLVLAMTLLPQASYVEALTQLVGVLPRLPWAGPGTCHRQPWSPGGAGGWVSRR